MGVDQDQDFVPVVTASEPTPLFTAEALLKEIDGLRHALETRAVIGQAVGMLMERYKLPAEHAWNALVRASQNGNMKLRELAERMTTNPVSDDAYPELRPLADAARGAERAAPNS